MADSSKTARGSGWRPERVSRSCGRGRRQDVERSWSDARRSQPAHRELEAPLRPARHLEVGRTARASAGRSNCRSAGRRATSRCRWSSRSTAGRPPPATTTCASIRTTAGSTSPRRATRCSVRASRSSLTPLRSLSRPRNTINGVSPTRTLRALRDLAHNCGQRLCGARLRPKGS